MNFNNAAPKCKVCNKTAYQQESLTYDSQTYHKTCFKCLQCGSRVALSKVAMIQGDLYCKNCFIRMFSEKGNYNVFLEKGSKPEPEAEPEVVVTPPAPVTPTAAAAEVQANANYIMSKPRRGSVLSCLMAGCGKPRAVGVNYCVEHNRIESESESLLLMQAITEKSTKDVRAVLLSEGVHLAVKPNSKRQTPVEIAFTNGSNACGVVMLELIAERLQSLQDQVRDLQDQLDAAGIDKNKLRVIARPRRNSAPRETIEDDLAEMKVNGDPSALPTSPSTSKLNPTHHTAMSEAIPSTIIPAEVNAATNPPQ